MKISGFTFIRNGLALGYPFVPAIQSLLPLCDEIIVNVPRSTDDTLAAVRKIGDPKIRIIESEWDEALRTAGLAMSHHTNIALRECTGDWCVYIQGDEVLHEETLPLMRAAMEREVNNPACRGFWLITRIFTAVIGRMRIPSAGISGKSAWCAGIQGFSHAVTRKVFAPWIMKNCT